MKNPYGYVPEKINLEDAIYGAIFQSAGEKPYNWKSFLPERERQYSIPFCVSFSRLNCAEAMGRRAGLELNLSDRHLGVISGTTKNGNGMFQVSEAFRNIGVVKEFVCPWEGDMLYLGTEEGNWKKIFDLSSVPATARRYKGGNHSWVDYWNIQLMREALAYSPLQLACPVYDNWEQSEVVDASRVGTALRGYHAITCYYIDDYIYIQDSIGREFKKLTLDYPLTGCKSFRDLPDNWKDLNNTTMFELIRKDNSVDVYAIKDNKRHLILNGQAFSRGIELGMWKKEIQTVSEAKFNNYQEGYVFVLPDSF